MCGNHFFKIGCVFASEFSGQQKPFFPLPQIFFKKFFIPASENTFFSPEEKFFTQNCFSCQRQPSFKLQRNLLKTCITATGNDLQLKLFPPSVNLFLQQILYCAQWKLILRLVETILFQFLKYPFYWKQGFHLVEIHFKHIFYYDQWQQIFCLIKCRPNFKQEHYSCSFKPFSWIFTDIPVSGSSFFRLVEMKILSNPSQRLVYSNFGLISNHILQFKAFFCYWKAGVNQFSSIFLLPNSGNSFSGYRKRIFFQCPFIKSKFRASGNHYPN